MNTRNVGHERRRGILVVLLLAAFGGFVALIHRGGLADYVLTIAM